MRKTIAELEESNLALQLRITALNEDLNLESTRASELSERLSITLTERDDARISVSILEAEKEDLLSDVSLLNSDLRLVRNEMTAKDALLAALQSQVDPEFDEPVDNPDMDATDAAHPAWWRGHEHGAASIVTVIRKILDGKDLGLGYGWSHEPWHALRRDLLEIRPYMKSILELVQARNSTTTEVRFMDMIETECPECGFGLMIVDGVNFPVGSGKRWLLCMAPDCIKTKKIPEGYVVIDD